MPFDHDDLADVARYLNGEDTAPTQAARQRVAIGRFYYAVFWRAREVCETHVRFFKALYNSGNSHEDVTQALFNLARKMADLSARQALHRATKTIEKLRFARVQCDYRRDDELRRWLERQREERELEGLLAETETQATVVLAALEAVDQHLRAHPADE